MKEQKENSKGSKKNWLKGLGLGAIIFFTLKGLAWLAVFFGLGSLISC
jgi:hypothetical protein